MTESRGNVTGKRIILEIVREMRDGLHPLLYSRVAPGLYCVYLHPDDYTHIEGLAPRIRAEAQRALAEELRRLNTPEAPPAFRWFVAAADPAPPVEEPAAGWEIQIEADRDEEVEPGSFVILSKLTLPPLPQFEGGAPTTKVFRTVVGAAGGRTKTEQVLPASPVHVPAAALSPVDPPPAAAPPALAVAKVPAAAAPASAETIDLPGLSRTGPRGLARIALADARGARVFVMDKHDIKIGRGGQFRLVDLQLEGPTRISRVHARIRRDDRGRFFIKDLSEWGTTVNGERIARGVIKEGEEVREIDVEAELPPRARIGLADVLFLDFTAGGSA